MRAYRKVGARHRRTQIGIGRAPAPTVFHQLLVVAAPGLIAAVEVGIDLEAERLHGGEVGIRQRMQDAWILHLQRAIVPSHRRIPANARFRALEVRQQVIPAPTACAERDPVLVVLRLTTHVRVSVDRTRSTKHFAARTGDRAVVYGGAGRVVVAPGDLRIEHGARETGRHADPQLVVGAACFEDQYAMRARGAQPIGEHATGCARADDDVVPLLGVRACGHGPSPFLWMRIDPEC